MRIFLLLCAHFCNFCLFIPFFLFVVVYFYHVLLLLFFLFAVAFAYLSWLFACCFFGRWHTQTDIHTLVILSCPLSAPLGRPLIKPLLLLFVVITLSVCVRLSSPLWALFYLCVFVVLLYLHLPSSHARSSQALARNSFYIFCAPFYVLWLYLKSTTPPPPLHTVAPFPIRIALLPSVFWAFW